MGRALPFLLLLALQVYALVDVVRSPSVDVRTIPKALWVLVVLIPVVGPVTWFLWGRPRVGPASGGGSGGGGGIVGGPRPRGPVAPDDDPEFLKRLDEQSWAARMERLRREREAGGPGGSGPGAGGSPASDPQDQT